MNEALAKLVRERARGQCEYCHLPERWSSIPFEIDHIIARKHHGPTTEDNLAFSRFYCNSAKGTNIAGIDPESGAIVRLFHPRRDRWELHFAWNGGFLQGLTSEGRATLAVLEINDQSSVGLRELLLSAGLFPVDG
jgi:hypothetical protein